MHTHCLFMLVMLSSALAIEPLAASSPATAPRQTWGVRPTEGEHSERNPPAFSWAPVRGAATYELQVARDEDFNDVAYTAGDIEFNVHCPARALAAGAWRWRVRPVDADGRPGAWCAPRGFALGAEAAVFTLPERAALLARVPDDHPRLFLRPEGLDPVRERAKGVDAATFARIVERCDAHLASPPSTAEPLRYSEAEPRKSEAWRARWWGNRQATIAVLESAATLAFAWRVGGNEAHGALARRLLLDAAAWDPKGATGYRYNDEAAMPFAYHFSRTYTWLHAYLNEAERQTCRDVMRIRGGEMYEHLCPRHLWEPYSSHSNRAWHFLGEVGIAFHGELPEADDWTWFAVNVFACVYPVWSDDDGGWHEGLAYWRSYLERFTWWADVQREALSLDAYALPFFARAGELALYTLPPGSPAGGFGDLAGNRAGAAYRDLMTVFAAQARNAAWTDWVERCGGPVTSDGYVQFLRAGAPAVKGGGLAERPTSKLFRGTGVAALNTSLIDAQENVQVLFKASPFGTQSHGYEAQNAFLLRAYGERLFVRSGRRDTYGSPHHTGWMWQTKSVNSVVVDGHGQLAHTSNARGEITAFHTEPGLHFVVGEAGRAYGARVQRFERAVLLVEPDFVLLVDRVAADGAERFDWLLHAEVPFELGDGEACITTGRAACRVEFLSPEGLELSQTDRFEPPPVERVMLVQHHLTATARSSGRVEFVTVLRPTRLGAAAPARATITCTDDGRLVRAPLGDGEVAVALRTDGALVVTRTPTNGAPAMTQLVGRSSAR